MARLFFFRYLGYILGESWGCKSWIHSFGVIQVIQVKSLGNGGHPGFWKKNRMVKRNGIHMFFQPRISKERWFAFIQRKKSSEVRFEFTLKEISYPRAVGTKTNPQNEVLFCRGPNEVFDRSVKCCKLGAMKIGVAIVPFICSFG